MSDTKRARYTLEFKMEAVRLVRGTFSTEPLYDHQNGGNTPIILRACRV